MEGGEEGRPHGGWRFMGGTAMAPPIEVVVSGGGNNKGGGEAPERLGADGVCAAMLVGEVGEGRGRGGGAGGDDAE